MSHLEIVEERLNAAKLKINPDKCTWCAGNIKLLGHYVSYNQVMMDPAKIEAISKREEPRNAKQVQEFLGIANYYRRFGREFAKVAKPLHDLIKLDVQFVWNETTKKAFDDLKELLCKYPILRQPNFKIRFILYTDSSNYALGVILSQEDDDKKDYVIAYASRLLKGAELNYPITQKECLV